jgi:hypothetical protein
MIVALFQMAHLQSFCVMKNLQRKVVNRMLKLLDQVEVALLLLFKVEKI